MQNHRAQLTLPLVVAAAAVSAHAAIAAPPPHERRTDDAGPVTFSLLEALAAAEATVAGRQTEKRCSFSKRTGRFSCGPRDWQFVGPWAGRSNGEAVRCLWVHPPRSGKRLMLRWPKVPIGGALQASLRLADGAGQRETVRTTIRVDGRQLARLETRSPRAPARADAEVPPGPRHARLEIEVHASDSAWRLACIDVRMVGERRQR